MKLIYIKSTIGPKNHSTIRRKLKEKKLHLTFLNSMIPKLFRKILIKKKPLMKFIKKNEKQ